MSENPEQTDNPPTEDDLEVEAPNESAPGHNPPEDDDEDDAAA